MDVRNLFSSTKKKEEIEKMEKEQEEEMEKEQKDRDREEQNEIIERNRVKIIQPLDIDKMKEFKNRTIQFISQCKKKEYIYDYFQRMSSNVFYSKNNSRPFLIHLGEIIMKSIPIHEEHELQLLMNNLEYDHTRNKEILAMIHSKFIIDTLYDYCKSVDTEIAEINENSKL